MMVDPTPEPGGHSEVKAYDAFGQAYAEHSETSPYNALYDRPAILTLAGDVTGRSVLDVGCASGLLTALLADRGATVIGLDSSPVMLNLARQRCGNLARFHQADLAHPLDFLPDEHVDLVTASLVLHYLRDWRLPLSELCRVLRPNGALVFSVHHPDDWHWFRRPNYFATERVTDVWPLNGHPHEVSFYRRPLSATFSALREAGFLVDRVEEPMPVPECAQLAPDAYATMTSKPTFLYFRAVKPARTHGDE